MPLPEITLHDREKALAEMERIAHTLNQMSQWLGGAGEQRTAVMLEEAKLTPQSLVETVSSLLADAVRLRKMGEAARSLSHPDAARDIAAMAAKLAHTAK